MYDDTVDVTSQQHIFLFFRSKSVQREKYNLFQIHSDKTIIERNKHVCSVVHVTLGIIYNYSGYWKVICRRIYIRHCRRIITSPGTDIFPYHMFACLTNTASWRPLLTNTDTDTIQSYRIFLHLALTGEAPLIPHSRMKLIYIIIVWKTVSLLCFVIKVENIDNYYHRIFNSISPLLISGMFFNSNLSRKKYKGQNVYLTLMAPGSVFPTPWWGWFTSDAQTTGNICQIHSRFPIRKYTRYGQTSNSRVKQTLPWFWKSSSTPKNTLIFKDSIKIDHFRAKTVNTRYVGAST